MARLPIPGQDEGAWGDILNQFLLTSHANDGNLKSGAVTQAALDDGAIVESKLAQSVQDKLNAAAPQSALDAKANTADLATVATSGDYNDLVNTPTVAVSDADIAAYIQDLTSSTYAALVSVIRDVYATTYTPLSVVGTRAGGPSFTGAYPSGAAVGDVAIVTRSTNSGSPDLPPSGWSILRQGSAVPYYGCSMGIYAKVLTASDVTNGLTGWTGGMALALHVLRGVDLPTDALIQNGWTDSTTYQLPALTATEKAPKLVMTIMTTLASPVNQIEYLSPYTDFIEFYSGGTSYVAQGILQASTTARTFSILDPNGHATWTTASISLSLTNG